MTQEVFIVFTCHILSVLTKIRATHVRVNIAKVNSPTLLIDFKKDF